MKKPALALILALFLFGLLASASASMLSALQQVNFVYYDNSSYWGFIYDYTHSKIEDKTPGFITYDTSLQYICVFDVQVAYIYNTASGRYTEALALRNVIL